MLTQEQPQPGGLERLDADEEEHSPDRLVHARMRGYERLEPDGTDASGRDGETELRLSDRT